MIRFVTSDTQINQYIRMDVHAIQIFSLYESYGLKYEFLQFWIQDQDGCITALIGKMDGVVTLSFIQGADLKELQIFLDAVGFDSLRCNCEFESNMPFDEGLIMRKYHWSKRKPCLIATSPCSVQDVLHLNAEWISDIATEAWYADVSHRIRHGTVQAFGVTVVGAVASTALLTTVKQRYAVISYLSTQIAYRRCGLASALLADITQNETNEYYLLCEAEIENYYKNNGFEPVGNWRNYYR